MSLDDSTIYAPSSGLGRAGIAVIRVSGPCARHALDTLAGGVSEPRRLKRADLVDGEAGQLIDQGMVVWFPAPHSFTGENMAEFHVHGGMAVVAKMLAALGALDNFHPAQPGAFTKRAFLNGKLDLVEVEGLADLINAETEAQRKQAVRQMAGELGALYEGWRTKLIRILAHMEAALDFPDEEDVPDRTDDALRIETGAIEREISRHLDDGGKGEQLRRGIRIVIAGVPNVGKSSLLNRLARRDVAIVSTGAGTTRDVIEVHLDLEGLPVTLIDTAGLQDSEDDVEREGVARAREQAEKADLVVWLTQWGGDTEQYRTYGLPVDSDPILVLNKIDLSQPHERDDAVAGPGKPACAISAKTGEGIDDLIKVLRDKAAALADTGQAVLLTRARHRAALEACGGHLRRALQQDRDGELEAEEMRLAVRRLGSITGRVDVENILDVIFGDFCIGK